MLTKSVSMSYMQQEESALETTLLQGGIAMFSDQKAGSANSSSETTRR